MQYMVLAGDGKTLWETNDLAKATRQLLNERRLDPACVLVELIDKGVQVS